MELAAMTASELAKLLRTRQVSSQEIMRAVLSTISRRETEVQAYITLRSEEELLADAESMDLRLARGDDLGLLCGLPVAIKDNICTRGILTTCASRMLNNFVPPYDATVVGRIKRADGIVIGKTNLDEFAMGSTTEHSAYKVTRNPHDRLLVPGGTSGGSAAAVAANEAVAALGSDTGGSIRQPAAFCGVVGLKPTYGRVSRYGLVAYASSFDQIGPLTKDVSDAALLLSVISGRDSRDATSANLEVPNYVDTLDLKHPLRIGVPDEYLGPGLDDEIRKSIQTTIELCKASGHAIVPIHLELTPYALSAYYVLVCSEASSNLSRFDGCRYGYRAAEYEDLRDMYRKTRTEGFGDEVRRRILLGTYSLSAGYYDAYYNKATQVRKMIGAEFRSAFKECDAIMHPVTPTPPFEIGSKLVDPLAMYLADVYTVVANLVGVPAISIPCGWTRGGLPIGVQLVTDVFQEGLLLAAAFEVERLLNKSGVWQRNSKPTIERNVEPA